MKRIKMALLAVVFAVTLGAFSAGVANAGYFTGTLTVSNWLGSTGRCNFAIDTQKANPDTPPPADQLLLGGTFRGDPSGKSDYPPCDPEDLELSDISVDFEPHMVGPGFHEWDAILKAPFSVSALGCTFTTSADFRMHQLSIKYPANPSWGWYAGSGTAGGSPFFCGTATIAIFDFAYHANP